MNDKEGIAAITKYKLRCNENFPEKKFKDFQIRDSFSVHEEEDIAASPIQAFNL